MLDYGMTGGAGLAGGAAGGFGAYAMTPEGQGVQGQSGPGGMDRDMAMRMLIDPQVPAQEKRKILAALQAMDEQNPPSEQEYGGEGGGMGAGLLAAGGAIGGGMLGGMAGMRAASKWAPKMTQSMIPPVQGGNEFMNGMRSAMSPANLSGTGLGQVAGGVGGYALGDMAFGQSSPYEEPF
jgi:hypothetical protein